MASNGNLQWETNEVYHPEQVESILLGLHVDPAWETETNYLALCPFHGNTDTPSFSIDKTTGLFMCFNPDCGERGNLQQLVERVGGLNMFQARRFIDKYSHNIDVAAIIARNLEEPVEYPSFSQHTLDKLKRDFPGSPAQDYMRGRGFTDDVLDYFDIGYSSVQRMVAVPMHDPEGNPIGIIGRSTEGKSFKNSPGLPKSKTAWNFHRAKRESDTVIICESSFDAIRIHQSGFPNVVALLGGYASNHHVQQLGKAFSNIIIFTDADDAGRKLGRSIQEKFKDKRVMWAADCPEWIYPHSAKDASDLTDQEIKRLVTNAISTMEYEMWYD